VTGFASSPKPRPDLSGPHGPAGPSKARATELSTPSQVHQQHPGIDFESLWQQAPSAQLLLDDDGAITKVNDTFLHWTGHRREAVLATPFTRLLPIGDRILYSTHCVPQLMVTGRVSEASVQVLGADGTRHPALLSAVRRRLPVQSAPGGTSGSGDEGKSEGGDGDRGATGLVHGGGGGGSGGGNEREAQVSIVLVDARQRRRYEEELLAQRREAEEARARIAVAEARLQALVHRDPLTGLLNRSGPLEALTATFTALDTAQGSDAVSGDDGARAGESERQTTVVFIDLDGFKTVNDNLGHDAGDELLRIVADRITSSWRAGAIVARLAGDEFVLVDDLSEGHVPQAAERLLEALSQPVVLHGVEVVVSASIGVASTSLVSTGLVSTGLVSTGGLDAEEVSLGVSNADWVPTQDEDGTSVGSSPQVEAEVLLRRADVAMYRARAGGVGRFAVHRLGDPDPTADRLVLLEQLRTALREDQLRVHYQPRIDLRSGTIRGVEALVRWEHPERGLLSPAHFIEAAEQSGLIRDVGSWVLQQAVLQVAGTQRMSDVHRGGVPADLQVSVNVSARQLSDPELPMRVASILARAGLHAPRLVLEITETALMSQPETALVTLRRLKELGVLLAVDDFGTGYSSFSYLKQFPVDELKIDRSFVSELTSDVGDAAIVASCVHLAHAMGKVVVAEGVETVAQQRALRALDCDQAQGYLFSRPLPWDRIRWTPGHDLGWGSL
jgi:diguanylate cyclase (GGDEF)-like protein